MSEHKITIWQYNCLLLYKWTQLIQEFARTFWRPQLRPHYLQIQHRKLCSSLVRRILRRLSQASESLIRHKNITFSFPWETGSCIFRPKTPVEAAGNPLQPSESLPGSYQSSVLIRFGGWGWAQNLQVSIHSNFGIRGGSKNRNPVDIKGPQYFLMQIPANMTGAAIMISRHVSAVRTPRQLL